MLRNKFYTLTGVFALLVASCAPLAATPSPIITEEPGAPVMGVATVQSVEIQILESQPVQVNAIVRGQLPDASCTTITSVEQVRNGNIINLTLVTTTDPLARCAQALTPFEQVIPIDISNLPPGQYTVNAGGVQRSFELPAVDSAQLEQMLVDALNARDYEQLKSLMGETFTIGYWQSEGTSSSPEQAVDLFQRSLLNSTTPIVADPTRDLVALLGMDPVVIMGPQAVEAEPLFTSGWGPAGNDEAILFTAKRPDGGLYWYGMLYAGGGFAGMVPGTPDSGSPTAPTEPVDTTARPTSVQFVMAQQEVSIRSGPGMGFNILGSVAEGQTAKVTGVSADGNWWRVICPDNSTGSCWVSASPDLTQPSAGVVNPPLASDPVQPTNVQYVMALKDISIYGGPGAQYGVIGSVANGQTAQVTGVSAGGGWWRVICPNDSVGDCWVSANPGDTQPTQPPG